jgi:hypothetical protein
MLGRKKLQVFVSSTYRDLKVERQAAVEAILKAGHIPAGMELFASGSESQLETIRRWIDDSDVYMLILAGRYGSIEPKTSLSYVELEYDYAVASKKPIFAVVIAETALDAKVKNEGKDVLETESPKELKYFKDKVLSRISAFFSDSKDIKLAVHETLADYEKRLNFTGWVSGKDVVDTTPLLEQISTLRQEKENLQAELVELKLSAARPTTKQTAAWSDDELREIAKTLLGIEVSTNAFSSDKTKPAASFDVLSVLLSMRDRLITGVSNKYEASESDIFLYFNVCPKLEVYDLAALEKVAGVQWQRYRLTGKGKALLVFADKHTSKAPAPAKSAERKEGITPARARKRIAKVARGA